MTADSHLLVTVRILFDTSLVQVVGISSHSSLHCSVMMGLAFWLRGRLRTTTRIFGGSIC